MSLPTVPGGGYTYQIYVCITRGSVFAASTFYPTFALKNDPSFNSDGDGVGELAVKLYHIIGMYIGQL